MAMENGPFINDFPIKTSIQCGDCPWPCLMTPDGSSFLFQFLWRVDPRKASLYEAECLQLSADSAEKVAEKSGDLVSQFRARHAKKAAETLGGIATGRYPLDPSGKLK